MAYPVIAAPYGFKPNKLIGGQPFAGATRQIPVAYNYGTDLNNGDLVKLTAGTVKITALTSAQATYDAGTIGVFLGCSYTSPISGQKIFANMLPANTLANDIMAYVEDDPDVVFKVVVTASTTGAYTDILPVSQAYVGTNVYVNASSTPPDTGIVPAIGQSAMSVMATTSTDLPKTATAPFRIVGLVPETAVVVSLAGTTATASGVSTLTVTSGNAALLNVGMQVYGPGIFQGAYNYITAISTNAVTLANTVTTTQSTAVGFTAIGYPEVLVKWNFGYHSYYAAAGA